MFTKKHAITACKIAVLIICLAIVFQNIDLGELKTILTEDLPLHIIMAGFACLLLSQTISALRMRYYFTQSDIHLNRPFAIGLYFVGALYNSILPGGIGGDGYKVYKMKQIADVPYKKSICLLISDRASGLLLLLLSVYLFSSIGSIKDMLAIPFFMLAILLPIITVIGYLLCIYYLLNETPRIALGAIPYSLVIQGLAIAFGSLLFWQLGESLTNAQLFSYVAIFQFSILVSVVPISFGGAGLRELTFMYAAQWFGLSAELGIAVCLILHITLLAVSSLGILAINRLERLY